MSRFKYNARFTDILQRTDPSALSGEVFASVFDDGEYIVEKHPMSAHEIQRSQFDLRLVVSRQDKTPIRSWRLLQDIKNEIVGVDRTAIEVYPPECEVTDTGNLYHLWVYKVGCGPRVNLTRPITRE